MRRTPVGRVSVLLITTLALAACSAPHDQSGEATETAPSERLAALVEEAWQKQVSRSPYLQRKMGLLLRELPEITPEQAAADAADARELLEELAAISEADLSHEERLTLAVLSWDADRLLDAEPYYWLTFPYTPYLTGFELNLVHQVLAAHPFADAEHPDNYLGLLGEYADRVDQLRAHAEGQAEHGIYLALPAMPGVSGMFGSFRDNAEGLFAVAPGRLAALEETEREEFSASVAEAIAGRIVPALDAFLAFFESATYDANASDRVGMAQYPDGEAFYRRRVKAYTTMDVTPEALHELGRTRVEELSAEMAAIRAEVGFEGSQAEFHDMLRNDPRFLAKTPQEVEDRFNEYVDRMRPLVPDLFTTLPKAPYGVRRLDPAAEGSMTFGYYQPPTPDEPTGLYRYNGSNLEDRSLIFAGPLIFHELIPGHHFHLATQSENESLPLYRREYLTAGAFNEGWGNYAARLAREQGLMDDPYDRYGWAIFDMFISVRLVVDTGMNLMGWSLEEGRDFMRRHTFQSETEIATESLRYSTDLFGQALAYKAGLEKLLELREKARATAGDGFDLREFHAAVLGSGAMPLVVLEDHVDWYFSGDGPAGS